VKAGQRLLTTLNIIQIVLAVFLIGLILLQTKGSSFGGGGSSGNANSIFRTRRGFEKRLFQFTIGFAVVFVLICLWASFVTK